MQPLSKGLKIFWQRLESQTPQKAQNKTIKGDNFIMQKDGKPTQAEVKVKFEMPRELKQKIGINPSKNLSADLVFLQSKHPEMFSNYGKAYQTLLNIKNTPKWRLKNNRDDISMIARDLPNNKIGKMGIKKENNEVRHLTIRNPRASDEAKKSPLEVESPTHSTPLQTQGKAGTNRAFSKGDKNSSTKQNQKQEITPFTRE